MSRNKNQQVSADAADLQIGDSPTTTATNTVQTSDAVRLILEEMAARPARFLVITAGEGSTTILKPEVLAQFGEDGSKEQVAMFDFSKATAIENVVKQGDYAGKTLVTIVATVTIGEGDPFACRINGGDAQRVIASGNAKWNTKVIYRDGENRKGAKIKYSQLVPTSPA